VLWPRTVTVYYTVIALPLDKLQYMERGTGELYRNYSTPLLGLLPSEENKSNKFNLRLHGERPCEPNVRERSLLLQPRPGPHPAHPMGRQARAQLRIPGEVVCRVCI
jgi:hypothetical protein